MAASGSIHSPVDAVKTAANNLISFFIGLILMLWSSSGVDAADYVENEVIVRYAERTTAATINSIEAVYGLELIAKIDLINARLYRLRPDHDYLRLHQQLVSTPAVLSVERNSIYTSQVIPADPYFDRQWYLHNTGQLINDVAGSADSDIDLPEALEIFDGVASIVVAVVDSGIALNHPELAPRIWLNPLEAANGIDDDNNGLIDDINGWNFIDDSPNVEDTMGHGTMIANIIGGVIGNGHGGAGIAPSVQVMPLKVCEENCTIGNILKALDYANQNNVRLVNASLTGLADPLLNAAIRELANAGILVVVAAGNGGIDGVGDDVDVDRLFHNDYYSHTNTIAVSATDSNDRLASFSNYGVFGVDVAAPGVNVFSADINRLVHLDDDFENGLSNWVIGHTASSSAVYDWNLYTDSSGNHWLSDSLDANAQPINYVAGSESWIKTDFYTLNLAPKLKFNILYALSDTTTISDLFFIEVSADDITWAPVRIITGHSSSLCPECTVASMQRAYLEVNGLNGSTVKFRFRLKTDSANHFDGVYLDNIRLDDVLPFAYNGTQYQFGSGTSYAAPVVTGIAALLWSQRPDLSYQFIKQIILETVDHKPSLDGFVKTGGRVNARAALELAKNYNSSGLVQFDAVQHSVSEGSGSVELALTRSQGAVGEVSITYTVNAITPFLFSNYASYQDTVLFADGETTQYISLPVYDDLLATEDGVLELVLSTVSDASLGLKDTAVLTIVDNDQPAAAAGQIEFEHQRYRVAEGSGHVDLSLIRTQGSAGNVSIAYVIRSASPLTAYASAVGSAVFADGQVTQVISIPVYDDLRDSEDGILDVTLTSATGAALGSNVTARLTITDDDAAPSSSTIVPELTSASVQPEPTGGSGGLTLSFLVLMLVPTVFRLARMLHDLDSRGRLAKQVGRSPADS